jgi:hypothetical protein
MWVCKK